MEDRKKLRMNKAFRDEHVIDGVMCGIDAVGFQARSRDDYNRDDPNWIIHSLAKLVNPTGHIGIIGVFPRKDPLGIDPQERGGELTVPWATFFNKGISVSFGRDQDKRYDNMLRNMICGRPNAARQDRVEPAVYLRGAPSLQSVRQTGKRLHPGRARSEGLGEPFA